MIIKNALPTIITDHIDNTTAELKTIGFVQKHHFSDGNNLELTIMESVGGSRISLVTPPKAGLKMATGYTVIIDDLDESVAYLSANGFKPLTGVISTAHTKITIMHWEAVNTMICVMKHVKD